MAGPVPPERAEASHGWAYQISASAGEGPAIHIIVIARLDRAIQ
jgi:hypothetical protein